MNKILKILVLSDIFLLTGFGFVSPILAVFIKDDLVGGTLFAAGLASAIFMITHSILQIIFSSIFNPKDRWWMILLGTGIIAIVPFCYLFSTNIWHIYIVQFFYGVGAGFAYPTWASFFTSNLDRGKRGFQWSLYSSSVGIGTAIAASTGAFIAERFGFNVVFIFTGLFTILSFLMLFLLDKKELLKKI